MDKGFGRAHTTNGEGRPSYALRQLMSIADDFWDDHETPASSQSVPATCGGTVRDHDPVNPYARQVWQRNG